MDRPGPVTIYTTIGRNDWRTLARSLVEERLAACVNAIPIESVYRWEGAIEEDTEMALLVKTTQVQADAAKARIAQLHPYDTPCIEQWPVDDVAEAYFAWMRQSTLP